MRVNEAVIERLEKVIDTLRDNSVKMGQMLALHDQKLTKQDRIDAVLFEKVESVHREVNRQAQEIKAGCERDIRKVDDRLRVMEKKMWSIFGALAVISFIVSPVGQKIVGTLINSSEVERINQIDTVSGMLTMKKEMYMLWKIHNGVVKWTSIMTSCFYYGDMIGYSQY